jgi:hypothetical protein
VHHSLIRLTLLTTAALLVTAAPALAQGNGPGGGAGPGPAPGTELTAFETDDFSGAGVCAFCHSGLSDEAGHDVSNDAHWRSTMMANASKDPLWQAKISSEIDRAPHVQAVIEEKCSRCHMGMARYQALTDGTPVDVLEPGFLDPGHYLHEAAMDGVSCTLCHQVQPDGLGTEASFTGAYVIDTSTVPPDRVIFGPYDGPPANPMANNSGFTPTPGAQITDPAHCGSCHTLYTPTLDAGGNVVGEFPEQTTYLEWEHAGFPATCQDCHLPDAVGAVKISNRPRRLAAREPFGQHHFVGGNGFMLRMLRDNGAALGVTAEAAHFDDTLARTETQLLEGTATLGVTATLEGEELTATVEVASLVGHKLPSGLPSRRAWLHLVVRDRRGATVFESGRPLPDGRIEGNDADADPQAFEPHHDLITSAGQVQIYEPVMLDTDGGVTWTLLRADSYAKDNRLLPSGFDKATASPDFAVLGGAAEDANFLGGGDLVTYRVPVSGARGPFEVTAELLFQTVSHPFVRDLSATGTDLVARFLTLHEAADKAPELLAAGQASTP